MEQITLKNIDGSLVAFGGVQYPKSIVTAGTQRQQWQGSDEVELTVKTPVLLLAEIGASTVIYGRPYFLNYAPQIDILNDHSYIYTFTLEGMHSLFARVLLFNKGLPELAFSLIGTAAEFMALVTANFTRAGDTRATLVIDNTAQDTGITKELSFDKENCLTAINKICEAFALRYAFTMEIVAGKYAMTLNLFGGEEMRLYSERPRLGFGLSALKVTPDANREFVTRLFPLGSEKNLPPDYRGFARNLLPSGVDYVADAAKVAKYGLYESVTNVDSIYPRSFGRVTALSTVKTQNVLIGTTAGSNIVAMNAPNNPINYHAGDVLSGNANIPAGATITAVGENTFTISENATGTAGYTHTVLTLNPIKYISSPMDTVAGSAIVTPYVFVDQAFSRSDNFHTTNGSTQVDLGLYDNIDDYKIGDVITGCAAIPNGTTILSARRGFPDREPGKEIPPSLFLSHAATATGDYPVTVTTPAIPPIPANMAIYHIGDSLSGNINIPDGARITLVEGTTFTITSPAIATATNIPTTIATVGDGSGCMFVDSAMSFDLNAAGPNGTLYLIEGVAATVTFNSGNLAGFSFALKNYDHATKTFEIIPVTDSRNLTTPEPFIYFLQVGDLYVLTDINLPQPYIDAAEAELRTYIEALVYPNLSTPSIISDITLDGLYYKRIFEVSGMTYYHKSDAITHPRTINNIYECGILLQVEQPGFTLPELFITALDRDILNPWQYGKISVGLNKYTSLALELLKSRDIFETRLNSSKISSTSKNYRI